jgi:outer membrane protein assembly factor BamE (lipoprotein component of BamABCDE complex)
MEKQGIRSVVGAFAVASILALNGCIIYNSDTRYAEQGKPISERTLDEIERGQTSQDWIIATFGEPSSRRSRQNGTEILEYRFSQKRDKNFVVLPLLIVNYEGETLQTVFVEIGDGIVKDYWVEKTKR